METTGETALWRLPAMRQLVVLTILGFVSFALTLASLPSYAVRSGASPEAAGLVTTVMLAATVLVQTAVPVIVSRIGLSRTLALGLVALGAPAPLYLVDSGLGWLLAVSAVRGVGFAVLTVIGSTLTALIAPPGRQGEAVGLYGLAIAVPNLLAIPGGTALTAAGEFGWVAWLAAAPLIAVPAALSLGRSVHQPSLGAAPRGSSRAAVRASVSPTLVLLVVTLAGGGLVTFLPIERPTGAVAAVALLVFGVTGALTRWLAGTAADRVGTRLLLPGFLLLAVGGLVLVAVSLVSGSDLLVVIGAAVMGAGFGAVQNLTLLVAFARAGSAHTTTASAVWNAGFDLGTAIGAVAVGALAAGVTLPWAFGASAVLMLLSLPLAVAVTKASPSRST